jgi:hypothetical protein
MEDYSYISLKSYTVIVVDFGAVQAYGYGLFKPFKNLVIYLQALHKTVL